MDSSSPKSRSRAAVSALVSSYIKTSVLVVIGFIVTPIILKFIGKENYGIWAIIGSMLGYMGMLELGLTGSVSTLIARKQNEPSGDDINSIVSNAIFLHTIIGLAVLGTGCAVSFYLPDFFRISPDLFDITWKAFILATVGLSISFPLRSIKAVLRGTQNIATLNWLELANFLVRTGLILFLLFVGFDLIALPLGAIVVNTVALFVFYYFSTRTYPQLDISLSFVKIKEIKKIFSVSLWWFLGGIGALFIYLTDNIVIGHFLGPAFVTVYVLTYRVAELGRQQIYQINSAMMPGVSDLVSRKEYEKLQYVFLTSMKTIVMLSFILCLFIMIYNRDIVKYWVGEEYFGGNIITIIFAISLFQMTIFHNASVILTSFLKLKRLSVIRWTEGIINLLLSIVLVKYYGIIGVALATLAAGLVTSFWYVPLNASRLLGIGLSKLIHSVALPSLKFLVFLAPVGLIFSSLGKENLITLIFSIMGFGTISLFMVFFISFDRHERHSIIRRVAGS